MSSRRYCIEEFSSEKWEWANVQEFLHTLISCLSPGSTTWASFWHFPQSVPFWREGKDLVHRLQTAIVESMETQTRNRTDSSLFQNHNLVVICSFPTLTHNYILLMQRIHFCRFKKARSTPLECLMGFCSLRHWCYEHQCIGAHEIRLH